MGMARHGILTSSNHASTAYADFSVCVASQRRRMLEVGMALLVSAQEVRGMHRDKRRRDGVDVSLSLS